MAGHHLTPVDRELGEYLGVLERELGGPPSHRREIVAEVLDGMLDAVDVHRDRGLSASEAAAVVVREFGEPAELAREFEPELVAVQSRRMALGLVATGPVVGGLWLLALVSSLGRLPVPPWHSGLSGVWMFLPALGVVLVTAMVAIVVTIAVTGRLSSVLPGRSRVAPTAVATAGVAAAGCDLTMLVVAAGYAVAAPEHLAWLTITVAALASLTRLVLAGTVTRRSLAARTRLS